MSGVFESIERHPVTYTPTGDHALLVSWYVNGKGLPCAVLCLEDGEAVAATTAEFTFDYRYSLKDQAWFDVSRIEETDADADQEAPDDGGPRVPGLVPDPERAGPSDPIDES